MPETLLDQDVFDAIAAAKQPAIQEVNIDGRPTPITKPFASPADWRDHWIYFLMVDRFNNPNGSPRDQWDGISTRFQGGTFEGIRRQLPYLKKLGVGAIWLTPVFQNPPSQEGSFHGYGIQHFLKIHPRYATPGADPEAELQALIDEAHARGIYVIFDIVLNHAGNIFAYVLDDGTVVDETGWSDTDYRIRWRGADGVPRADWEDAPPEGTSGLTPDAAVWPSEIRKNEYFRKRGRGGVLGGDFASLKELITGNEAVRNALIRIYQWVMARFDIDGYRIDTLMYVERDFARIFGNAMREFAQQIGKKNFFTFGEVYDNEETIAHFIGRHALDPNETTGIDAALDFPAFYKLPGISKGVTRPSDLVGVFEHRKAVQRGIISSHSEASRYFVTFCDNHDMKERIRYVDPADPSRYDHQVAMAIGCLFALQGIPCLYYGTEQGLSGRGNSDAAVREALWGKPNAFDVDNKFYRMVRSLAAVRATCPALRYGRQYFRPLSGDRQNFGISNFAPGILAFSRILNDEEVIYISNATEDTISIVVIVDGTLHSAGTVFRILYSNEAAPTVPGPVETISNVRVEEVDGSIGTGPVTVLPVTLAPGETQILGR